eukprot:TRINITY_DN5255_c0_g1_i1.p1 TRINITY_DN5255_c0_g1~~TRINITY_DN5255_c0_g1_i1.p1  ORF type:complete len:165 (+),score=37.29 TRINITY_DN5255_c0_g1_i1:94-588(+)
MEQEHCGWCTTKNTEICLEGIFLKPYYPVEWDKSEVCKWEFGDSTPTPDPPDTEKTSDEPSEYTEIESTTNGGVVDPKFFSIDSLEGILAIILAVICGFCIGITIVVAYHKINRVYFKKSLVDPILVKNMADEENYSLDVDDEVFVNIVREEMINNEPRNRRSI